ncbi:hypothetical protein E2C01_047220 [Portunus trituberculatus]|uniref:Uncharacterized protein n=1 Tax=Portunus trituberculatus TaxID=210409 RepID=A0A5B7G0J9_PORTR|nr:hypothetical protein [Portunus trituberculatus]
MNSQCSRSEARSIHSTAFRVFTHNSVKHARSRPLRCPPVGFLFCLSKTCFLTFLPLSRYQRQYVPLGNFH